MSPESDLKLFAAGNIIKHMLLPWNLFQPTHKWEFQMSSNFYKENRLMVTIKMPRKNFKCCRFLESFIILIDSSVYLSLKSQDSLEYSPSGSSVYFLAYSPQRIVLEAAE
jgi:hypothetical protein